MKTTFERYRRAMFQVPGRGRAWRQLLVLHAGQLLSPLQHCSQEAAATALAARLVEEMSPTCNQSTRASWRMQ